MGICTTSMISVLLPDAMGHNIRYIREDLAALSRNVRQTETEEFEPITGRQALREVIRPYRQVEEVIRPYRQAADDAIPAESNSYSAPAHASSDSVDFGAYTGDGGAFGWYADLPVLLARGYGH